MIKSLEIENFKSIQKQTVELGNLNVLIGPNGAGKSNFVSLFKFLERLGEKQLADYIYKSGGINSFLFQGFEKSPNLKIAIFIDDLTTGIKFYENEIFTDGESYQIKRETVSEKGLEGSFRSSVPNGGAETLVFGKINEKLFHNINEVFVDIINQFKIFHFNDTSENAQIKLPQSIEDVYYFKPEGENLAPFLLYLKENNFDIYFRIVETVRLIFPLFHDFALEESPHAKGKVMLRWKEKGSDQIYTAKQISDGTLRFICLATLLLQPADSKQVPRTIILDEPELGLHPFAISILAELVQKAAMEKQVILATQSVSLINHFTPKDLLITERNREGATEFKRLKDDDFQKWLEDYSLGQLWESNFFGGRP